MRFQDFPVAIIALGASLSLCGPGAHAATGVPLPFPAIPQPIDDSKARSLSSLEVDFSPGFPLSPAVTPSSSAPAGGGNFDIDITFNLSGLTASEATQVQNAYNSAEAFYETIITGYIVPGPIPDPLSPGNNITALDIDATVQAIDGVGGTLGQAGPNQGITFSNTAGDRLTYVTDGVMFFDSADVSTLLSSGTFLDVVIHEMSHVLGFGTLWDPLFLDGVFKVYDAVTLPGEYTGPNALAKYIEEFDPFATFIPVETGSGLPGTDHSHWAELSSPPFAGGANEILTGFLNPTNFFSDTSLHAFRDLGYTTLNTVQLPPPPVPLPFSGILLGSAAIGLWGMRRVTSA